MKNMERRKFMGSVISVFGMTSLGYTGITRSSIEQIESAKSGRNIRLRGIQNSKVIHWDIITIGNLSRNRYGGESDERAIRSAICTCSIISGEDFHVIIDPSLDDEKAMGTELYRRTGLTPDKIDVVFITHQHGDHIVGLKHFMKARWLAGSDVASGLNNSASLPKQIESAEKSLFGTIDVIPTPGHTSDHQSLRFDYRGMSIVIAGDSVATKDFWDERRAYYNVLDLKESKRSMEKIDSIADVIVPGHDNYFFNIE
jgi:hypothetical protein